MSLLDRLPSSLIISMIFSNYLTISDLRNLQFVSKACYSFAQLSAMEISTLEGFVLETNSSSNATFTILESTQQISTLCKLYSVLSPKIFIIGGLPDIRRVDILHLHTMKFRRAASLLFKRNQEFDAILHHKNIYVISGCSDSAIGSVEVYDINTRTWRQSARLPIPIVNTAAVSYREKLYCIGGYNHNNFQKIAAVYELLEQNNRNNDIIDEWIISSIPSLPSPRAYHAVSIYHNEIWVAGGANLSPATNTIEIFDFTMNRWYPGPNMTTCRRHFSLLVIRDVLYAVGGDVDGLEIKIGSIEKYDVHSNIWMLIAYFPNKTSKYCSCSVDNQYIIIFGNQSTSSWNVFDTISNDWIQRGDEIPDRKFFASGRVVSFQPKRWK